MKKVLSLFLCLLMLVGVLAACGDTLPEGGIQIDAEGDGDDNGVSGSSGNGSKNEATVKGKTNYGLFIQGVIAEFECDDKGRIANVYVLDEKLERNNGYAMGVYSEEDVPMFGFVYGNDGKISSFKSDGEEFPLLYGTDGSIRIEETEFSEAMDVTVTYHANGSLKELTCEIPDQPDDKISYVFDEQGRMISTSMASWESSDPDGRPEEEYDLRMNVAQSVVYVYTVKYEANKCTMTVTRDGVAGNDSVTLEFDDNGRPVKRNVSFEYESQAETEWTWENDRVVKVVSLGGGTENDGDNVYEYLVEETLVLTYNENGLLAREDMSYVGKMNGEEMYRDEEYMLYDYNEDGKLAKKALYAKGSDELQHEEEFFYDENGKLTGMKEVYSDGSEYEYDAEGQLLREVSVGDMWDGNDEWCGTWREETVYDYDVPTAMPYDEIRYVKESRYDADGNLEFADEYAKVFFFSYEYWEKIDERTGEPIRDFDGSRYYDSYGNYTYPESDEIYYFQKYVDTDGSWFYYTAQGVKTPYTPAPAEAA